MSSEPLNAVDAAWFRMDQVVNPADTLVLLRLEGRLEVEPFRALVQSRLLRHARFRRRAVSGGFGRSRPYWEEDPEFSLETHVPEIRLAISDDVELGALLHRLSNQRLDLRRSPWKLWLIQDEHRGSWVFAQIHHCMGDGFALLEVLLSMADRGEGSAAPVAPEPETAARPVQSWLSRAAHAFGEVGAHCSALERLLRLSFDDKTALRGDPAGERKIAWSAPVTVDRIKNLARARSSTVNDVLLAAIAGALRRYLIEADDDPRSVRAILPVNLRPASQPVELQRGNFFGLVFPDMPLGTADPEARLSSVKREMDRLKRSRESSVSLLVLHVVGRLPSWLSRPLERVFTKKASVVISNVPGPREPLYLAGQRVDEVTFWVAHPCGLACGVSAISYAGALRLGVRADTAVIAEPERIARHFDEELASWFASAAV